MRPARDLASLSGRESLFAASAAGKLARLQKELEPLAERYDVVVANPPYMGAKNMNKWLSEWVKDKYPDVKGDLFSCFIVRNSLMGADHAQLGFMTPYVWMFIGTYEKLRHFVTRQNTITSLIQLEYSGFAGATVPICTFTLQKGCLPGYKGGYVRLSDFVGADQQAPRALEALANPDCGWFYRRSADAFAAIPGSPIAYWFTDTFFDTFVKGCPLSRIAKPRVGLQTSDNNRFLRYWFECDSSNIDLECKTPKDSCESNAMWYPHNKGGSFCRWYGNCEYVINYRHNGAELDAYEGASTIPNNLAFREAITYSRISSGEISFRKQFGGMVFDSAAVVFFPPPNLFDYLLALMNTSLISKYAEVLVPTLNAQPGDISKIPVLIDKRQISAISSIVNQNLLCAKSDWDSFETSWDFARHPLV